MPTQLKLYLVDKYGVKDIGELNSLIEGGINELLAEWHKENNLEVYNDERYFFDIHNCYMIRGRTTAKNTYKYFKDKKVNSVLDYFTGNGLTTLFLSELFPNTKIYYYNKVQAQVDFMHEYADSMNISMKNIKPHDGEVVDLVFLSEVFEHFEEPEEFFINEIESNLSAEGYISHSSPFGYDSIGHFEGYYGITGKKYHKRFHSFLESRGLKFLHMCFNNIPRIYGREKISEKGSIFW